MTKADLVEKVARDAEMTKKEPKSCRDYFRKHTGSLNKGEKIELRGFGSFECASEIPEKAEIRKPARRRYSRKTRCVFQTRQRAERADK